MILQHDAPRLVERRVQCRERVLHLQRGAGRPQGVVLVKDGQAEDGHHRIADEFLHGPAVVLEDRPDGVEVARHHGPQRLGARAAAVLHGGPGVREDQRHGLAPLRRGRGEVQRGAARPAAAEVGEVLLAAVRAETPVAGLGGMLAEQLLGGFRQGDEPDGLQRFRGALRDERRHRLRLDERRHLLVGRRGEEHLERRRVLLHGRRDPDGVARQHVLALARLADDDLPARHAGPVHEPDPVHPLELVVERVERAEALRRGRDGAERVVIVVRGQAEDGEDGVADDLLDRPATRLEDQAHLVEVPGQELAQGLRVQSLTETGRALQVGRDDRHRPADLLGRAGCIQHGAAVAATSEPVGDRSSAARAWRRADHRHAGRV